MSSESQDPMTDDELMRALGGTARALREEEGISSLERWTRGELDEQAARAASPLAGAPAAPELFAPWDDAARDALAQRMLDLARPVAGAGAARQTAPASVSGASEAPQRERAHRRRALVAASGVALAAAVVLLLSVREAPLPAYRAALSAGDRPLRAESAPEPGPPRVREDSTLELRLWPETAVGAPISSVLLVRGTRDSRFVSVRVDGEIATSGAVRWRGTARDLVAGRRGELTLRAAVGRAGELPSIDEVVRLAPGHHGSWSSVEVSLSVSAE